MHATGYDFKQAVGWLRYEHSAELAVAAATHHGARQAQEIAAREVRPAFVPPQEDRARWNQVRDYLTDMRALPERVVDELHKEGTLYAADLAIGLASLACSSCGRNGRHTSRYREAM